MSNIKVTGTGLEEVIVDPDSIERLRKLAEQGELDIDPERDLLKDPMTLEEVFDTIDARVQRRLKESGGHEVYKTLAEKIERLRKQAAQSASDTIEFLKKALDVASGHPSRPQHRRTHPDRQRVQARRHPDHRG
jgi:type I restriction enzyme R subunit